MNKKIILNWLPPSMIHLPSPAMSVLKRFLESNGYKVDVIYWNIKLLHLEQEFLWLNKDNTAFSEDYSELLFLNYIAVKSKDQEAYAKVKSTLYSLKPQYLSEGCSYFDNHMSTFAAKLEHFLYDELSKYDNKEILYWGLSVNLYQWIFASILAKFIKTFDPKAIIAIGGIGTKEAAIGYLNSFEVFDIALWGEGEYNLLSLTKCIESGSDDYSCIPNAIYRDISHTNVLESSITNHKFIDLSSKDILPDINDYIDEIKNTDPSILKDCNLFLENSRGCHWKKCHFCYLNNGYKHRLKSVQAIDAEIRTMIEKYHIYSFYFVDNDLIANNWERFSELLDSLLSIKKDYPQFEINLAEIITKDINASFIKRMSLAGFRNVQIGYESPSNTLLHKIEKKNTFASNLLFIKYAMKFDIKVNGANVICGLLEETEDDILESIENLRFLRFFLKEGNFRHNMSHLGVMSSSRYFKQIKEDLASYSPNYLIYLLPKGYISEDEYKNCSFLEVTNNITKKSWRNFIKTEQYYLGSNFSYRLYKIDNSIIYSEKLNYSEINRLEIEIDSLDYIILSNSNENVLSFKQLKEIISTTHYNNILDCELYDVIENLRKEGLLYTPYDYSEFIAVIDINDII